jgi:hypothetical protein
MIAQTFEDMKEKVYYQQQQVMDQNSVQKTKSTGSTKPSHDLHGFENFT